MERTDAIPAEARGFVRQVQVEYEKLSDPAFLSEMLAKKLLEPINAMTEQPTSHGAKIMALAMGIVGVMAHAVDHSPETTPQNRTMMIAAGLNAVTRIMIDLHKEGGVGVLDDQLETAHGRC